MSLGDLYKDRHQRVEWYGGVISGPLAANYSGVLLTVPTSIRGALLDSIVVTDQCFVLDDLSFATITSNVARAPLWVGGRAGGTPQVVFSEILIDTNPNLGDGVARLNPLSGSAPLFYLPPEGFYIPGGQIIAVVNGTIADALVADVHVIEDQADPSV